MHEKQTPKKIKCIWRKRKFAYQYVKCGFSIKEAMKDIGLKSISRRSVEKYLNEPFVIDCIEKYMQELKEECTITFNWKLEKLKQCVDMSMPKDINDISPEEAKTINPQAAIKAIAEMNRMQGDIAPVKNANVNANFNVDTDIDTAESLIKKYEKPY